MTPLLALTIRLADPAIGAMVDIREHLFLLGLSRLIYGLPHQAELSIVVHGKSVWLHCNYRTERAVLAPVLAARNRELSACLVQLYTAQQRQVKRDGAR